MTGPTRRIEAGRGHWYKLEGDKVDGVTTVLRNGVPKPALVGWAARTIAEYVADRIEYDDERGWSAAPLVRDLEKKARTGHKRWRQGSRIDIVEQLKGVHWDERDAGANRGTEVHKLAERITRGEELDVPDVLVGHVDSYIQFLDDWQPTDLLLERTIINRRWRYMGTFDIVCKIAGRWWLIDIKTNRSGVFADMALQQAMYRYAETYLDEDGAEQPMPPIEQCAVLWVRADGYDLIPVLADESIFRIGLYAQQMGRFLNRDDIVGQSLQPPARRTA